MGAFVTGSKAARVRIKGHWQSVTRFFFIAVGFMMTWILISSELGYYSKWFGPQILLELTMAFYLPSIPILIISGQLEKALDAWVGPVKSMAIRLNVGLAGCTACCAAFPFLPTTHTTLLWLVAVLGMLSAVAFSTAYQLVQWFRHADIIGLGMGGVGTGPMVLLLQLGLAAGPLPQRWQWIAMFEITAGISAIGLFSSISLFGQYWKIMTGEEDYTEESSLTQPMLQDAESQEAEDAAAQLEAAHEEGAMQLVRATTQRIVLPPDPFHGLPLVLDSGNIVWDSDDGSPPRLHRANSIGTVQDILHHHEKGSNWRIASGRSLGADGSLSRPRSALNGAHPSYARTYSTGHYCSAGQYGTSLPRVRWPGDCSPGEQPAGHRLSSPDPSRPPAAVFFGRSDQPEQYHPPLTCSTISQGYGHAAADGSLHNLTPGDWGTPSKEVGAAAVAAAGEQGVANVHGSVGTPTCQQHAEGSGSWQQHEREAAPRLTVTQESIAVFKDAWQVLLAFLMSVTVMYLIFPFFTYVPQSGLFGDALPQVLFFSRIFADLVGRFAPRRKELLVNSPSVLLTMATAKVVTAALFFVYIKLPGHFHRDALSLAVVIFVWTLGGYINTCANILAPSLVHPELVSRASALLALIFQVAHFAGLLLAVLLAWVLFGDIVG